MKNNKMIAAQTGADVPDCPRDVPADVPDRKPRRSKEEIQADRIRKALRKRQREERVAERVRVEAAMKLIREARAKRAVVALETASKNAEKIEARINSRARTTNRRWDVERKEERKRERKRLRDLHNRHKVGQDEPEAVRDERDWLASNDRPKIIVDVEPEPVLGMVGFVSEVRRHEPPMLEVPPPEWNEGWAAKRIIDAYRTLTLMPGNTRPAGFGRAWPAYVTEFSDAVAQARTNGAKVKVIEVATIEDIERMDRVFAWPARFLRDRPEESRALFRWANAKVIRGDMRDLARSFRMSEATFRRFRRYSTSLLTARLREGLESIF